MEYRLDIFTRNSGTVLARLAENCKARRLEKGYSRRTLAEMTGVTAPTIEHFDLEGA